MQFVSSISYEAAIMEVYNGKALAASPKFAAYELEDTNVDDLASFALTNAIFATLVEGHATEIVSLCLPLIEQRVLTMLRVSQCARRNAMDNASKNAGELINKLTMQFNRMRQANITNELVDIIVSSPCFRSYSRWNSSLTAFLSQTGASAL